MENLKKYIILTLLKGNIQQYLENLSSEYIGKSFSRIKKMQSLTLLRNEASISTQLRKETNLQKINKEEKSSRKPCQPVFEGLKILMVSEPYENMSKEVKKEIEKRRGRFLYLSGEENIEMIISKIKESNLIFIYFKNVSPRILNIIKDNCSRNRRIIMLTKSMNKYSVVSRLSVMKKKLKLN